MRIPYLPDSDDSPPDFSKPIPPLDPEEIKRFKERKEREEREEREKQEARARARAAADARNRAAMEEQRRAGPHPDVIRRVKEARARAAGKDDDTPATPDRKRKGRKRRRRAAATVQPALPTECELLSAMKNAETSEDVFAAVSRWCWAQANNGTVCPPPRMTSMERLATDLIAIKRQESAALEFRLLGSVSGRWIKANDDPPLVAALYTTKDGAVRSLTSVETAHRDWLQAQQHDPDLPHPLALVVDAWQRRAPIPVEVDRHPRAILSVSLRAAQRNQDVLPLTLDHDTPLGPLATESKQGYLLPEWEPAPSLVPPVSWLTLYDLTAAGPMQTRGRGAPLAQRLFVEILTSVHVGDRDPEWITAPPITLRDMFEWCWPRWYDRERDVMRGGYQRNKHLPLLRRALVELDNFRIVYDHMDRRLIRVDDLPNASTALDAPVRFHVRHLPGSDRGPAIDRLSVRRWGLQSAAAYRSTIRLAYLWDEAKGRNNGHRIYATRPVVARVAGPGSPLIGADGKALRDSGGAVVKNWNDPRAVILGANGKPVGADNPIAFERNPAADRIPTLGPDDLIRLAFDDDLDIPAASRRKRLERARETLANLEAFGEVVIEHDGDGMRIIEVRPDTWSRAT